MNKIGVAIIGCGGITLQNHLPGLALCRQAAIVALCDSDPVVLTRAQERTGVATASTRYEEILKRDEVQAVIIATPNITHAPIVLAATAAGKHVLCEKPIAMNPAEAQQMCEAANRAGVRHMTAFTYRFVPAMRYLAHLVQRGRLGRLYHFRACRLQDWGQRGLGWRQSAKLAGTGELGDMLSHRIDYAHLLVGPITRLTAGVRRFHDVRGGTASDLEDWVALLAEFEGGATGVWESSKVATGRGEGAHSQDYVEINGSDGSAVFQLERPHELQIADRIGTSLHAVPVPREFLTWPGSPRDPGEGDPMLSFRYDQDFEFIDAIRAGRPCVPSLEEGARVQGVMAAAMAAASQRRWVRVKY